MHNREEVRINSNDVTVYFTDGTVVAVHNGGDHLVTVNRGDDTDPGDPTEVIAH